MSVSWKRWLAKKAARNAVMATGWATRNLRSGGNGHSAPEVRVLTYHGFGEATRDPYYVRPDVFEDHLRYIAEHDLAVSLDDVMAFVRGERLLKDGSVLVTMDDGLLSVAEHAAPLMKRYGVPGVAYITTALVGEDYTAQGNPERYLTWDEVEALPASGLTVGSHAHTHRSLGEMPLAEAREEGERSKELLDQHMDAPVESFAYPFGMRPDETPETARALTETGYTSVFIAQHGAIVQGADPARLPRIKVEGGELSLTFPLICQGAMDVWKVGDDTLWRLQRPPTDQA